jgi:transposase
MNVRYVVRLSAEERSELTALMCGGKCPVRRLRRAQILLAADSGARDEAIAKNLHVGTSTIFRVKRRFVEQGLAFALEEQRRLGAERKLTGKEEALLIATACTSPPDGAARWTLKLLAGAMVRLTSHESLSRETIRRRLVENDLKPWRRKMWCVAKIDAEYVARMEDILDLYAEEPDPRRPVVCFDETPRQLIGETRVPRPPKVGRPARFDYQYCRNGNANISVFLDVNRGWRNTYVNERRTGKEFADCMRDLVDVHYPEVDRIRVVLDNLSTHKPSALYEWYPPAEARRILRKLEFHYTPVHASWLNMVEIEIGVLSQQCLNRRIGDMPTLLHQISMWQSRRNSEKARISWLFTVDKARTKLGAAYPRRGLDESHACAA